MKSMMSLLVVGTIFCLGSCTRVAPDLGLKIYQDSCFLQFTANNVVYTFTDTVKQSDLQDTTLTIGFVYFDKFNGHISLGANIDSSTRSTGYGGNDISIQLNLPAGDSILTPGTYACNNCLSYGGGFLGQTDWDGLVSDTVTVTNVHNGLAAGTLSATFSLTGSDTILHISNGVFRNVIIQF